MNRITTGFSLVCIAATVLTAATGAAGAPSYSATTGHYYELVLDSGITWAAAKTAAEGLPPYLGQGGYLATITSLAENDFITGLLPVTPAWDEVYAIGGYQPAGSGEPSSNWQWIKGETWSYTNWRGGEPNNLYGDEDCLEIYTHSNTRGTWNDIRDTDVLDGYVVEYIPEPATLSLLAVGAIGLIRKRR